MVLGKLSVPGRSTNLDYSRAGAYCACSRCGWGLYGQLFETAVVNKPSEFEPARYHCRHDDFFLFYVRSSVKENIKLY